MELDYYEILEVTKTASGDEIKKSYRRLAMQCHPDKNPGCKVSEDKFKKITAAYEVLSDEQKRAAYDRFGHSAYTQNNAGGGGFGGFDFNFGAGGFSDILSEMFSEFMGGGRQNARKTSAQNGNDIRYDISISLEEAFSGIEKEIKYNSTTVCEQCHGQGSKDGSAPQTCPTCHGSGRVHQRQGGFFVVEAMCPKCQGQGYIITNPCPKCNGKGAVKIERKLKIKIPSGVETDTRMRVAGEGETGLKGGRNGDLYVFITIKNHKLYQRNGADLYTTVPVSLVNAALGDEIEIPGIDGEKINVEIKSGAQSGSQIRIKNEGMNVYNSTRRGDLYVNLKMETPVNLTPRQKELLEEFQTINQNNTPESKNFFEKLKDLF